MRFNNEPLSAWTHLIGALLSIAALVLMIVFASIKSTVWHIVSYSIFGTSLILLYLASTIFHFIRRDVKAKKLFERIDHSMIYVLIAGTYTPILLVPLRGALGWTLFGIIWGIAILGVVLKSTINMKEWFSTLLYVLMGWLIIFAIKPLLENIGILAFFWLLIGGIAYTIGAVFYYIDTKKEKGVLFGHHEIFHIFVMIGSFSHFWVMLKYLI
ncbi:hemolysin [Candidatus Woesearchaeota archaeon]|nr:MAG: hemolysin [Candidatus Woesearchaeota archaeon]